MGSSARKKKEKKKDFQKPKLRVGKAKAKADNFTDTSFKSRSIVINQQSLTSAAPSTTTQFTHALSLASTSKTDTQRRDALAQLTSILISQPVSQSIPVSPALILPKLLPLILDGNSSVRTNLLKFLRLLPSQDVADSAEFALLYVRAGMTHLAAEIRNDALNVLEWLVSVAGDALVSCPGGWAKTLKAFMSMLGWATSVAGTKWSAAAKATFGKGGKDFPRQILVLAQFLKAGLSKEAEKGDGEVKRGKDFPIWDTEMNGVPRQANAFAHLNLFGVQRDEEGEMYTERSARQRVFNRRFQAAVEKGVESAKKEAGEMGRAGAVLGKVVLESMQDFEEVDQDA